MAKKRTEQKRETLREHGCLNPRPERVTDPLFLEDEFFDSRDLVQTKYEMLRRMRVDGESVTCASRAFGFSRPAFYQAMEGFGRDGLAGLVPKKRGPRRGHKLTEEIVKFLAGVLETEGRLSAQVLAKRVEERFDMAVHPRSIERALDRSKKKLR